MKYEVRLDHNHIVVVYSSAYRISTSNYTHSPHLPGGAFMLSRLKLLIHCPMHEASGYDGTVDGPMIFKYALRQPLRFGAPVMACRSYLVLRFGAEDGQTTTKRGQGPTTGRVTQQPCFMVKTLLLGATTALHATSTNCTDSGPSTKPPHTVCLVRAMDNAHDDRALE